MNEADFQPFRDHDRVLEDRYGPRVSHSWRQWWPDRVRLVQEQFPSTAEDQAWWEAALGDYDLMGAIFRDILRLDLNDPNKEGRRFEVSRALGEQRLLQLMGRDYASASFLVVFEILTADHSRTQIARRTGISRSRVHRLLTGQEAPSRLDLEMIAKGYGKHPSYFREYRTDSIVRALITSLEEAPEYTADVYRRMAFR